MPLGHDLRALYERVGPDTRIVWIANPNNPTGTWLEAERVVDFLASLPGHVICVVDEAYTEYAQSDALGDAPTWLERFPNLVVTRTFSKAWGLAGARVGWLAGDPELVGYLRRVGLPYPLSKPAARTALSALEREEEVERRRDRIVAERSRVRERLEGLELPVASSEANFLLFFVDDPGEVQRRLAEEHGVIVRDRSGLRGLAGALRVTIGTPDENDRFLEGLREVLGR